jgi:hypothetical protein
MRVVIDCCLVLFHCFPLQLIMSHCDAMRCYAMLCDGAVVEMLDEQLLGPSPSYRHREVIERSVWLPWHAHLFSMHFVSFFIYSKYV